MTPAEKKCGVQIQIRLPNDLIEKRERMQKRLEFLRKVCVDYMDVPCKKCCVFPLCSQERDAIRALIEHGPEVSREFVKECVKTLVDTGTQSAMQAEYNVRQILQKARVTWGAPPSRKGK